jgi:hydroxyethylthiazole kinase-like uncharacterized protein yjeF
MQRLRSTDAWPVLNSAQVRQLEPALQALSPTPLMQNAGLACAQLALAIAPHARRIWVAAGPGNNGGDGLEAALHLHRWGKEVVVSYMAPPKPGPTDAQKALQRAKQAGVHIQSEVPSDWLQKMDERDLCLDALLGIGATRPLSPPLRDWILALRGCPGLVLAIDVPTGLNPQSGQWLGCENGESVAVRADHTLSLITLQSGLLMGHGRDVSGQIWLETLGYTPARHKVQPMAWLNRPDEPKPKLHASHKGSHGDVAVIGGKALSETGMGMTGAAILAATAAVHAGAGRVILSLLSGMASDSAPPDVMQAPWSELDLEKLHVVCGCGGGTAVMEVLPEVVQRSAQLVLDADGLNALALNPAMQGALSHRGNAQPTVLTPHPLEAARLLNTSTAQVQNDRLKAAQELAERFQCCVVLKGSGTVIAAPGLTPRINITGNGRLAIGGTGDVLAGQVGARMAQGLSAFDAACTAVAQHGQMADDWPQDTALTASRLAQGLI